MFVCSFVCLFVVYQKKNLAIPLVMQESDVIVNKATMGSERNDCLLIQNCRIVMF